VSRNKNDDTIDKSIIMPDVFIYEKVRQRDELDIYIPLETGDIYIYIHCTCIYMWMRTKVCFFLSPPIHSTYISMYSTQSLLFVDDVNTVGRGS